jgi:hypothetical protein
MTHPTPSTPPAAEPLELLALALIATAEALAVLIAAAVALLLLLAGWRPAPASAPTPPLHRPASPNRVKPTTAAGDALAGLRVVELRALARAAGHRQLARSGRRAQLLAALAAA